MDHWHIKIVNSKTIDRPEQTTTDKTKAIDLYNDAINDILRQDGVSIYKRGIRVTSFSDGSIVAITDCEQECSITEG